MSTDFFRKDMITILTASILFGDFDFVSILVYVIVLFTAFPIHEYAHGYVAYKLGDDTAYLQGRLSLNPLRHLDLVGTLCMILCGFGWAKPVPVNPVRFKKTSMKTGMALTALAGPLSNIIMSFLSYTLYKVLYYTAYAVASEFVFFIGQMFFIMALVNIGLAIFNLLPIPPLDGSRIFFAIIPEKYYWGIMKYEQYIRIGLFALIFLGVLDAPLSFIQNLFLKLFDFLTMFIDIIFTAL
ncbi:MAG: site-2 protease family protein [Acutalibacteraceae bacterium]